MFFQHSSQRLHKTWWTGPLFFVTPSSSGEERQRVAADCQSFSLNRGLPDWVFGRSFRRCFRWKKTDKRKMEGTGGGLERLFEGAVFFCWGGLALKQTAKAPWNRPNPKRIVSQPIFFRGEYVSCSECNYDGMYHGTPNMFQVLGCCLQNWRLELLMVFLGGKEGVSSIQTLAHILGEDSQKIAFFFFLTCLEMKLSLWNMLF